LFVSAASCALRASLSAHARLSLLAYLLKRLLISEYSVDSAVLVVPSALLIFCLITLPAFISFHVSSLIQSFGCIFLLVPNMLSLLASMVSLIRVQCSEGLS